MPREESAGIRGYPMDDDISIKEYLFQGANEDSGYRLFPDELENDDHVFFHGTAAGNLQSIIATGFKIAGSLPSISFARSCSLALSYACSARTEASPNGCILAVRFSCLGKPYIVSESFGIHVYNLDQQPALIGYCIVPADYVFR
jgi:hypothetical protein